jgi:hypothetical protein
LLNFAAAKLALFAGRLVLAHNRLLYPYQKWFLRVLAGAPEQPPGLIAAIEQLSREPSVAHASALYHLVAEFRAWPTGGVGWGEHFLRDAELGWFHGHAAIDDI